MQGYHNQPFMPDAKGTLALAVTTGKQSLSLKGRGPNIRFSGVSSDFRIEFGDGTETVDTPVGATPGSLAVRSGTLEVFSVPAGAVSMSYQGAGAATAEVSFGTGV